MTERVKLGTLKCGDKFVFRCERYKVVSAVNGLAVCINLDTGRRMDTDIESEVTVERGEKDGQNNR